MPEPADDEIYIGYLPQSPAGIASWVKKTVVLLFVVTIGVALAAATAQQPFSKGVHEFGVVRAVEGVVRTAPYPTLEVERPDSPDVLSRRTVSRYLLVNPFKHGADVADYDGRSVRAHGTLIYRGDQTMLEVVPGEVEATGPAGPPSAERPYGKQVLVGQIVDSKCYLGVMKPGSGKPHRSCAARCISGGIPPLFLVRDAEGPIRQLLLVGADGRAVNEEVLDMVAEPVRIEGEVVRLDDLWILKADPETYSRL